MQMKKVTKKDRYGNSVTVEYESPEKPFDYNKMFDSMLNQESSIPEPMAPPVMGEEFNMGDPMTHPGGPKGEDTVPAWLTPGEFVVNAEATEMFGPQIEAMNEVGRMVQGGQVPEYARAGKYIADQAKRSGRELGIEGAAGTMLGDASQFLMHPWIAAAMYALTPKTMGDATPTEEDYVYDTVMRDANMLNEGGSVPYDLQNPKNLTPAQRKELSYEDPILLDHIKDKMAERKKRFQDWGFNVEHEYGAPPELDYAFESPHSPSKGMWHARLGTGDSKETWVSDPTVNIPATPSLANYLVGEEEYSHMLGGWDPNRPEEGTYGVNDRLFEEMRAKQEAARNVGGYLTPDVSRVFDQTLASYIGANQADRSEAELPAMGRDEMLEIWNRSNITPGRSGFYNADRGFYKTLQDAVDGGTRGHNWVPFMYNDGGEVRRQAMAQAELLAALPGGPRTAKDYYAKQIAMQQAADQANANLAEMYDEMYRNDGGAIPIPYDQALLEAREGFRDDVYLDSLGKPTVGHGHLLGDEYMDRVGEKPFSKEELDGMFQQDIGSARAAARRNAEKYGVDFDSLDRRQQAALVSQAFQLGETGQGKFKKMWGAMAAGDNEGVRREAMDSNWYKQTPTRVEDLVEAFNVGGEVPTPFIAAPLLVEPQYRQGGGFMDWLFKDNRPDEMVGNYGVPQAIIDDANMNLREDKTGELVEPVLSIDETEEVVPDDLFPAHIKRQTGGHPYADAVPMAMEPPAVDSMHSQYRPGTVPPGEDMSVPGMSVPPNVAGEVTDAGERVSGAQALPVNVDSIVEEMYGTPTGGGGRGGKKPGSIEDHTQVTGGGGRGGRRGSRGEAIDANAARQGYVPATTQTMADNKKIQIGQAKVDNTQKQLDRAKEVLANTDPDSPYFEKRVANVEKLESDLRESKTLMNLKEMDEAIKGENAANNEAAMKRQKARDLENKKTGNATADAVIQEQIDKLNTEADEVESTTDQTTTSAGDQQTQSGATVNEVADNANPTNENTPQTDGVNTDDVTAAGEGASDADKGAATNMMKSIFGDLFNTGELQRAAIMYLGSRMMGYGHGGSLQWALKNYVNRVDTKNAEFKQLATSGKFTRDSLEAYRESGDPLDLIPTTNVKPGKITDQKVVVPGQGLVQVWENGEGVQYYRNRKGQNVRLEGSGARVYDKATMGPAAIKDEFKTWTSQQEGVLNQGLEQGDEGYISVNQVQIANEANAVFQDMITDSNLPVEDAEILKQGIGESINDYLAEMQAFQRGDRDEAPSSLKAFVRNRVQSRVMGISPADLAGSTIKGQHSINKAVRDDIIATHGSDANVNQHYSQMFQAAQAAWVKVPEDEKKRYNKLANTGATGLNGFLYFMKQLLNDDEKALSYVTQ